MTNRLSSRLSLLFQVALAQDFESSDSGDTVLEDVKAIRVVLVLDDTHCTQDRFSKVSGFEFGNQLLNAA